MTKDEAWGLITMIRDSVQGFYVKADVAAGSWHYALRKYSISEAMHAVDCFIATTDQPPTPKGIAAYCDRKRNEEEQRRRHLDAVTQYEDAELSFVNIPGNNRGEKVVHVCAERAAQHWTDGNRNEFFGDMLLNAKVLGITFAGIEYEKIQHSGNGVSEGFLAMAKSANNRQQR